MSNPIRDTERLNSLKLDTARRRHEREIKAMESANRAYKSELKKHHENEIVDIQNQHQYQLNKESEKKEKVLNEIRTHLDKTQEYTDKELRALKVQTEKERDKTQEKLSMDREKIIQNHEIHLSELNDRYTDAARKVNLEGQGRINEMKHNVEEQFVNTEAFNKKRINEQNQNFTTRFKTDALNYEKLKTDQDNQFKKEFLTTNQKQQVSMQNLTNEHNNQIEKRDTHFRQGLKEQDLFFEKKYGKQFEAHNHQFKELETRSKEESDKIKAALTEEVKRAQVKKDDPFYRFEALNPTLVELEDGVKINVKIPEYAKADVQLTTNNKEAIITFNRRYSDANRTPEGVINKLSKVESFTTRLQTGMVLDPKSIKSSYENGTMTYVIKKA